MRCTESGPDAENFFSSKKVTVRQNAAGTPNKYYAALNRAATCSFVRIICFLGLTWQISGHRLSSRITVFVVTFSVGRAFAKYFADFASPGTSLCKT